MHNKREIVFKKGTRVYCSKCGAYQLELAKNVRAKEYSEASKEMKANQEQERTCKCGGIFFKNEEGGMQFFTAHGWKPNYQSPL